MNALDKSIVLAFARNGMSIARTSRNVFLARQTIEYHMKKVREETGLNPREFNDLIQLVRIIIRDEPVLAEEDRAFCAGFILATEGIV